VAIALGYLGSREVNITLPSGRTLVRPVLSQMNPGLVSVLDIVRAITPLAWARFITMQSGGSYPIRRSATQCMVSLMQFGAAAAVAATCTMHADNQVMQTDTRCGHWQPSLLQAGCS
jgi:hypothetical protein